MSRLSRCVFGDLFLEDVRRYREERLASLGAELIFPLWGMSTTELARTFVDGGFRAVVVCVDTTQLNARFSGREYDAAFLAELPPSVDPCGENGEFHTFVYDGPIFRERVECSTGEAVTRERRFVFTDLVPCTTCRATDGAHGESDVTHSILLPSPGRLGLRQWLASRGGRLRHPIAVEKLIHRIG